MVLNELGRRISTALSTFTSSSDIDEKAFDALLKEIVTGLIEADVNVRLVHQLRQNIRKSVDFSSEANSAISADKRRKIVQKAVMDELVRLVDPGVEPYKPVKNKSNVIMFVGLQGAGKTTSCGKLAVTYARKGWKTCLVCADTYRAGAYDQLRQNATKAKIPYYGSFTETDAALIAKEGVDKFKLQKFEIIIVDTSGRHKQEDSLFEEMRDISNAVNPDHVIFVMDGTIGQAAELQAKAFKESVDVGSVIITKMDGHAKGGGAISAVAATKSPIIYIGTGEHMHDFERFAAQPFINKMLGLGDMGQLMEKVSDMKLDNTDMMKRVEQGKFSLRDFSEMIQHIMGLGPLSKVVGLIPGMSNILPPEMMGGQDENSSNQLKKFVNVMDSMTNAELDSDGSVFMKEPSRLARVCRGSGVPEDGVRGMLTMASGYGNMVKKMGGPKGMMSQMKNPEMMRQARAMGAGGGAGGMPDFSNPAAMAGMQNMMQQMMGGGAGRGGGMAGMQQMMQQMMGGAGGAAGMQQMMQQMMGGAGGMQNMMSQMGSLFGGMQGGGGGGGKRR
ncbi:signal recognition particle protein [Ramicandelaber brevisporus]|nr:signal recognition particle protein [Ramicandelaber brevisporus]